MENNSDFFAKEAEVLTALAHPARLEILELLRNGECCVCHIQAVLDQRQAYISQHLNLLRRAGIVTNRKEGKRVYYAVSRPDLFEMLDSLKGFLLARKREQAGFQTGPINVSPRQPCNCPQCTPAPV